MKKLLLVLAIGAFAACNDTATESEATSDTTSTMSTVDSTTMAPMDTTSHMSDSTGVKVDSAK
jgi:hypothetical protein